MTIALIALVVVICALLYGQYQREQAWTQERASLLNRIKPETAQPVPGEPVAESLPNVDMHSDDDFWKAREGVTHGSNS